MDEEASEDPKTVGKKYLCPQDNADSRQQLATGGEVVEHAYHCHLHNAMRWVIRQAKEEVREK